MPGDDTAESVDSVGRYRYADITLAELQEAINRAQAELAADPAALKELGISAKDLSEPLYTAQTPSGLDPATLIVLILIAAAKGAGAGAGTFVAKKAWSAVLKKVRHDHGVDALKDEDRKGE
jgi:hypothetical protein